MAAPATLVIAHFNDVYHPFEDKVRPASSRKAADKAFTSSPLLAAVAEGARRRRGAVPHGAEAAAGQPYCFLQRRRVQPEVSGCTKGPPGQLSLRATAAWRRPSPRAPTCCRCSTPTTSPPPSLATTTSVRYRYPSGVPRPWMRMAQRLARATDFGEDVFDELRRGCNFPWLLTVRGRFFGKS